MSKTLLLAGVAAVALAAAADPVRADNIVTNTWYTGYFNTGAPTILAGTPFALGTNGPILPPGSTGNAVAAPGTNGPLSLVITLPDGGYLTATDVENSGDQFAFDVNGSPATPAPPVYTGLEPPGQPGLAGGLTSTPTAGDFVGEDISAALSDANFSSGTFYLPPGTDTITGSVAASIANGDMNLIVVPTPEPATLSMLGIGLTGFGVARRRKRIAAR